MLKQGKNLINYIFRFLETCSVYLFRAALYELMLVLQKDVPFHISKAKKLSLANALAYFTGTLIPVQQREKFYNIRTWLVFVLARISSISVFTSLSRT
jgi:hypothetical protein